jgi:formiminotetrahydrofolate cyclodeaminase
MALTRKPLDEVLRAFASPDPTPGGGSASALAAALGASLLVMVARLPKSRSNSDEDRAALGRADAALAEVARQLIEAVDEDTVAYDRVVAAYRQPSSTDTEKAARVAGIQQALREATEVPLRVIRLAVRALEQAEVVARHGHRAAASDVGVAVELLRAGGYGARLNVDANVAAIRDEEYARTTATDSGRLAAEASALATRAVGLLA